MAELHTDDTFMYENCLVGDAAGMSGDPLVNRITHQRGPKAPSTESQTQALDDLVRDAEDLGLYSDQETEEESSDLISLFEHLRKHGAFDEETSDPMNTQVGGDHYRQGGIQPIEYIYANKLGFCEGSVVKYLTRYKYKNGLEDLKKAKHYIELLIEMEFNNYD